MSKCLNLNVFFKVTSLSSAAQIAINALPRPSLSSLCCPLQVKCYHRRAQTADRDTVFRLQFHTCTVHGAQLWFGKSELDEACTGEEEREEEGAKERN